jgi:UvrD-like helicase C-terminal domain
LGRRRRRAAQPARRESLERILRERRFFELGAAERRPRDLWRRLRFVLDQCRAWEEAGGVTLRQYLHWVEGQSAEGSRVIETVLPESDDDAVRILTIHGAKGLEFPIVVLSGLTTEMRAHPRGVEVRFPPTQGWAIKLHKGMSTTDFELTTPLDEQMDHDERLRLLYVATTRARDHLVVSVHRKGGNRNTKPGVAGGYPKRLRDNEGGLGLVGSITFVSPLAPIASRDPHRCHCGAKRPDGGERADDHAPVDVYALDCQEQRQSNKHCYKCGNRPDDQGDGRERRSRHAGETNASGACARCHATPSVDLWPLSASWCSRRRASGWPGRRSAVRKASGYGRGTSWSAASRARAAVI